MAERAASLGYGKPTGWMQGGMSGEPSNKKREPSLHNNSRLAVHFVVAFLLWGPGARERGHHSRIISVCTITDKRVAFGTGQPIDSGPRSGRLENKRVVSTSRVPRITKQNATPRVNDERGVKSCELFPASELVV